MVLVACAAVQLGTSLRALHRGARQTRLGGRLRNSSTARVSSSFWYDASLALDFEKKQARNAIESDLTAARIIDFHSWPGPRLSFVLVAPDRNLGGFKHITQPKGVKAHVVCAAREPVRCRGCHAAFSWIA